MKKTTSILFLKILILFFSAISSAQGTTWGWISFPQISAGETAQTFTSASTIDTNNNVYTAFYSNAASITLGNDTFTSESNIVKHYLVKYDQNGNIIWSKTNPLNSESIIDAMVSDQEGNIYITGYFSGSIAFDNLTLTSTNDWESAIFFAKYDASGQILWAKKVEATGGDIEQVSASDIAVDSNNNLYLTGTFYGDSVNFDNISLNRTGENDAFLAKYDANGNALWVRKGAGKAWQGQSNFVKTDNNGNVFVTGNFESSTMVFDNITLNNNTGISMYLLKYNSAGELQWGKKYGNTGNTGSIGITVDTQNNPYVIGSFTGFSLNFDSITLNNVMGGDNPHNIFITKYDNEGNVIWAKSAGGSEYEVPYDIVADEENNIYISGVFTSPELTLGSIILINGSVDGNNDSYIVKLDEMGSYIWACSIDGSGLAYANTLSIDSNNNLYVGGGYRNEAIFGDNFLETDGVLSTYIVKLLQNTLDSEETFLQKTVLYPNPTHNFILIDDFTNFAYSIIDASGKTVAKGKNDSKKIDVSSLPSGMYFLNINNSTTKFIKE